MHHIGIVVKILDKAIGYWAEVFGYEQSTQIVDNTRQKVWVVFMHRGCSLPIKLIFPVDEASQVYRFAKKGGGMHHFCFNCGELSHELACLQKLGLRVLIDSEPGEAFKGENIDFLFAKRLGNMELINTEKRCFLDMSEKENKKE